MEKKVVNGLQNIDGMIMVYHMDDEGRRQLLINVMREMNVSVRFVDEAEYAKPLADLLSITEEADKTPVPAGIAISDEMLVLVGFVQEKLNMVLAALREHQLIVKRKAMLTKSNQAWNGFELFDELTQEVAFVEKLRGKKQR